MSKAGTSIHGFVDLHIILPGLSTREVKMYIEDLVNNKSLLIHLIACYCQCGYHEQQLLTDTFMMWVPNSSGLLARNVPYL